VNYLVKNQITDDFLVDISAHAGKSKKVNMLSVAVYVQDNSTKKAPLNAAGLISGEL